MRAVADSERRCGRQRRACPSVEWRFGPRPGLVLVGMIGSEVPGRKGNGSTSLAASVVVSALPESRGWLAQQHVLGMISPSC